jgi:hypothetical protein
MNNYTPDFYGLKSQVSYHQAKFRQEASEANTLKIGQFGRQNSSETCRPNRSAVGPGNWLRKLFARLTHQTNPIGI